MLPPPVWYLRDDTDLGEQLNEALLRNARLGVRNTCELGWAEDALRKRNGDSDTPWPEGFPLPVVAMPAKSFAPDYWSFGSYEFTSRRLREALAQPPEVVEFVPIHWCRSSKAARLQDYRWMRVLALQEAIDLDRSECEMTSWPTGGPPRRVLAPVARVALRRDLVPRTGVFRVREAMSRIYVTDAAAERVLRAGCTGMSFDHPENEPFSDNGYYRTSDGMVQDQPPHE